LVAEHPVLRVGGAADTPAAATTLGRYLADDPDSTLHPVVATASAINFCARRHSLWRSTLDRLGSHVLAAQCGSPDSASGGPATLTVLNFLGLGTGSQTLMLGLLLSMVVLKQSLLIGGLLTGAFAVIGFLIPNFWLGAAIANRQRKIVRALPDALDMLVISIEAGQSFDQALKRVSARWYNPLTEEFSHILTEMALGRVAARRP
jgi:hypothetical protein